MNEVYDLGNGQETEFFKGRAGEFIKAFMRQGINKMGDCPLISDISQDLGSVMAQGVPAALESFDEGGNRFSGKSGQPSFCFIKRRLFLFCTERWFILCQLTEERLDFSSGITGITGR